MKIRIVAIPSGTEPKAVREKWVGLELPVVNRDRASGWMIDKPNQKNSDGYVVGIKVALDILGRTEAGAAHWWRQYVFTTSGYFVFSKDVCEEVK